VSKTPVKSVTPATKPPVPRKTTAKAPSDTAAARKTPAEASSTAKAPAKSGAKPPVAAKSGKTASPKTTHAVEERELATETSTSGASDNIHRFTDRFAPAKPPARMFAEASMEPPKPAAKVDPKIANAWKSKAGRELSEEELMAMPDTEYMNEKQLEFFRTRLQALKDDLLSNAGETTEHLREDTSIVPDPADRATIEEEHALELRTRDRERKLLKKIAQSLARIDAGDYGYCDETGEPIGLGRLIARPTATLSLEAQQRREMKQKMFGD
jgi:DnaK suppressor protein